MKLANLHHYLFFRSKIPSLIVSKVYSTLLDFAQNNIPILLVPGNHERSAFPESIFLNHPNIHIFDKPKTFFIEINNIKIGVSGFPNDRKNIRDNFLNLVEQTRHNSEYADIKLLCFHQTVEGAQVKNYTFRYGKDVIRKSDLLSDFIAVLSGHIHRKQIHWIETKNKKFPLIFSGSTERTSRAENDEDKGFYVMGFKQSCNGWRLMNLEFIKLEAIPIEERVFK